MGQIGSFGRKLALGFATVVLLAVVTGVVAIGSLRQTVAAKDRVLNVNARNLIDAEALDVAVEKKSSASRGLLLTGD